MRSTFIATSAELGQGVLADANKRGIAKTSECERTDGEAVTVFSRTVCVCPDLFGQSGS
jgi:hypothetical protein